jgi:hypothetical protein
MRSPTQRSLKLLRDRGLTCEVTETFNFYTKRRNDLMGFCDILAMGMAFPAAGGTMRECAIAVQTTSGSNFAARRKKILAEPRAVLWLKAGNRIEVHGWRKAGERGKKKTWQCRIEEISL